MHFNFTESLEYKFIKSGHYTVILVIVGVEPGVAKSISEGVMMSLSNWTEPLKPLLSSSHPLESFARLEMVGSNEDNVFGTLGRFARARGQIRNDPDVPFPPDKHQSHFGDPAEGKHH